MPIDLRRHILIDHHAHTMREEFLQLDAIGFRQAFTESRSLVQFELHVPNSISYIDMLDKLGRFLDVTGEERILQLRDSMAPADYTNLLLDDASIGAFIIDDGFRMMPLAHFAHLCERPVFRCRRIESAIEEILLEARDFADFESKFADALLTSPEYKIVGLKTIAAYRGGLDIELVKRSDARANFDAVRFEQQHSGKPRITRGAFYHYFLANAFVLAQENNLPVQVHTGIGDQDQDMILANPLCLRRVLESPRFSKTKFVLLHCYPYVREAAYLCSIYPNVYMDISLVSFQASPAVSDCFKDALACAPISKILASTDGHSVPESYWYSSLSLRRGLSHCLQDLINREFLDEAIAERAAASILHGNAMQLYQLEGLK